MEFPKIGDKYRSHFSGGEYEVVRVNEDTRCITLQDFYQQKISIGTGSLDSLFKKIEPEIELGSRWLLHNGRLITVSSKDHGQIKYYFGEAYCFTKVQFSKYEHNFLLDCYPFTGDLNDYDISGDKVVPLAATGTVEITSSDDSVSLEKVGDYIYATPNTGFPDIVCNISSENYVTSKECEMIVQQALSKTFLKASSRNNNEQLVDSRNPPEKKPLWKRILRKLV